MRRPGLVTRSFCVLSTLLCGLAGTAAAQVTHISTSTLGAAANQDSYDATVTPNGRYVVFTSRATNLVTGDNNESSDVFLKDVQTGTLTRVSVASDGAERPGDSGIGPPDISADGDVIVFASRAAFAAGDDNTCIVPPAAAPALPCPDIYVHVRSTGVTERISVTSNGTQANHASAAPAISDDGRYVVFSSHASNLVAGDTNTSEDVFLHDRVTKVTTRVSVSSEGVQGNTTSYKPAISADGAVIAFISGAQTLTTTPDPIPCTPGLPCGRPFLHTRATGETTRIDVTDWAIEPSFAGFAGALSLAIDATGQRVAIKPTGRNGEVGMGHVMLFDRASGRTRRVASAPTPPPGTAGTEVTVSDNGRVVSLSGATIKFTNSPMTTADVVTGRTESAPSQESGSEYRPSLSADGRFLVFSSTDLLTLPGTGLRKIFLQDRDPDGDGLFTAWETFFGFDPASAADAGADPDADGLTNLEEHAAGSHPNGLYKRYLAEGAANAFFRTRIAMANPNATAGTAVVRLFGGNGHVAARSVALPARQRADVSVRSGSFAPDDAFATVVESSVPLVVDRTMSWDANEQPFGDTRDYGSHAEGASSEPGATWYLAEGATHGSFDLFYLLQNANDTAALVTVKYLRPQGAAPIVRSYEVGARSRLTIWVDDQGPDLAETDVSAVITSDSPIMVERAMYMTSDPAQPFTAGHAGAGVTAPALQWFLAEGATGSFFDLYVLIANPGTQDAELKVTYLLTDGPPLVKTYTVARESRRTISVENEDALLASAPVSIVVESTNSQPVIVERSMWWPSPVWQEGHLAAGATTTGTRWAVADGLVRMTDVGGVEVPVTETYILIANTSDTAGNATITTLPVTGESRTATIPLPARSRVNVPMSATFPGGAEAFGTLVESDGVQIVVERSMYSTVAGVPWSAGTAILATRLDP